MLMAIQIPIVEFNPTKFASEIWDHPARFKQICWHRRARKTTLALNKLIKEACATENCVYGYIGPTYKQAKSIIWRDPRMLKRWLPREVLKKDPNESELYCEFITGSILQVLGADDPDSLRGKNFKGVVLDEWALMKPMVWEEILRPILTENKGWAWFLFTPKGKNHAFKYWNQCKQWGIDWQTFFLSVQNSGLIEQHELDMARNEMPEMLYKQEFECEFLEGEGSVFRGINKCISGELTGPASGGRYIMGVDLAKTEDYTVIIVFDQFSKRVVAFERFNQISWSLQKLKIMAIAKKYNDALCVIDSTGVGDPIVEDLQTNGLSVERFQFTTKSKKELIERLILAIEQRLILFPKINELIEELESFSYEITPNGFKYTAPDGYHDDCVIALGLAVHGLQGFLYSNTEQGQETNNFETIESSYR